MAGVVDVVYLVRVKSYGGQAFRKAGLLGPRCIRLNANCDFDRSEMVLILCHELAHQLAGVQESHSDDWRIAYASFVRQAGRLGLLTPEETDQGVKMALHGAATSFLGWPERAEKLRQARRRQAARFRAVLMQSGVKAGSLIVFRYKRRQWRGGVIRLNRYTVSVGEPTGTETLVRVPFQRVLQICE